MSFHVQHKTFTRSPLSDLLKLLRDNGIEPNGIGGVNFDPDHAEHQDVWLVFTHEQDKDGEPKSVLESNGYEDIAEDAKWFDDSVIIHEVLAKLEPDYRIMSVIRLHRPEDGMVWSIGVRAHDRFRTQ